MISAPAGLVIIQTERPCCMAIVTVHTMANLSADYLWAGTVMGNKAYAPSLRSPGQNGHYIGIDLSPVLCYDPNNRTVRDSLYPQGIP